MILRVDKYEDCKVKCESLTLCDDFIFHYREWNNCEMIFANQTSTKPSK